LPVEWRPRLRLTVNPEKRSHHRGPVEAFRVGEWLPCHRMSCGPRQRRPSRMFVIFHVPAEAHTRGKAPADQRSASKKLVLIREPFAHELFVNLVSLVLPPTRSPELPPIETRELPLHR
jgi:hypothetical protein